MASRCEVEVTVTSAKDLKNVNWRHGPVKPYVVVWVDPDRKVSSRVDEEGDTCPRWDQTLVVPLDGRPLEEAVLHVDLVHARRSAEEDDTKPLVGSARLPLRDVVDDVGVGARATKTLKLKRPSGRPQGKLEVEVAVRDARYRAQEQYPAPSYGVRETGGYGAGAEYPYSAPPSTPYAAPPAGYPYGHPAYGQPAYGQPPYGQPSYGQPAYGQPSYGQPGGYGYGQGQGPVVVEEKKKSKFGGMGTGLAVGAVGGALGGLALAEGFDALEDHIADEAADRVEDDLAAGDVDDYGGDDGW